MSGKIDNTLFIDSRLVKECANKSTCTGTYELPILGSAIRILSLSPTYFLCYSPVNESLTPDLQKHLDAIKDTNSPKGIQDILDKKGDEFKKLEEVFNKKCNQQFQEKLKDANDTLKAQVREQMDKLHEIFDENYDRFRDMAAARHYQEVKVRTRAT